MSVDENGEKDAVIDNYIHDRRAEVSIGVHRQKSGAFVLRLKLRDASDQQYHSIPLKFRTRRGATAFLEQIAACGRTAQMQLGSPPPAPPYYPAPPGWVPPAPPPPIR